MWRSLKIPTLNNKNAIDSYILLDVAGGEKTWTILNRITYHNNVIKNSFETNS
jgi:hypothetical protein